LQQPESSRKHRQIKILERFDSAVSRSCEAPSRSVLAIAVNARSRSRKPAPPYLPIRAFSPGPRYVRDVRETAGGIPCRRNGRFRIVRQELRVPAQPFTSCGRRCRRVVAAAPRISLHFIDCH